MVGILLSYWGGLFSGAMLVSGRVHSPFLSTCLGLLPSRLAAGGLHLLNIYFIQLLGGYFVDVVQLCLSISHPHPFLGLVVWRQPLSQQDYKTEAKAEDIPQTFGRHTSSKQLSGMDKEPNGVYQQYRRSEV